MWVSIIYCLLYLKVQFLNASVWNVVGLGYTLHGTPLFICFHVNKQGSGFTHVLKYVHAAIPYSMG